MNQNEDIIRMARDAGSIDSEDVIETVYATFAAAERERMISEGWRRCAVGQKTTQFCGLANVAVQAEREACAKVCDKWVTAEDCAAAIRSRGEK